MKQPNADMLLKTMMSAGISKEHIAFGMKGTSVSIAENVSSRISKLFTSEHMGDVHKDGMSTYERIHNCGYTDVVDHNLRKHFGFDHSAYYVCEQFFLQRLQKYGVKIGDVFDIEHSPLGQLLYGKFVGNDPINDESLVPDEPAQKTLDLLKSVLMPAFKSNYGGTDENKSHA